MKWSNGKLEQIREDEAPIILAWPHDAPKMALFKGQHRRAKERQVIAWYSLDQFLVLIGLYAPKHLEKISEWALRHEKDE